MIIVTLVNPDAPLFFGKVTEGDTTTVPANATAIVAAPVNVSNIVPWGIPEDLLNYTGEVVLKWGSGPAGGSEGGNFQALGIDKPGGSEYKENIIEGAETDLKQWDYVDTQTGGLTGPTKQGAESRIYDYPNNLLDGFSYLAGSYSGSNYLLVPDSQFIIIPVIESLVDAHGHSEVQIVDFACFIITEVQDMSGDSEYGNGVAIVGEFLDYAMINSNGSVAAVQENGLRVIRLIE